VSFSFVDVVMLLHAYMIAGEI